MKYILSIVIPFGFMYLIGCGVYGSWSLLDWTYAGRVLVGLTASLASLISLLHYLCLDLSKIGIDEVDVNDILVNDSEIVNNGKL